jgi:hypothetical protein
MTVKKFQKMKPAPNLVQTAKNKTGTEGARRKPFFITRLVLAGKGENYIRFAVTSRKNDERRSHCAHRFLIAFKTGMEVCQAAGNERC